MQELQELTDFLKEPRTALDQGLPDYSREHGEENGPRNPCEVPIQIRTAYAIVPVFVNGEGPYQFMLDTGAASCTVSPELAEALQNVYRTLLENQQPLGEPFESLLYSNRWELYE